MDHGRGLALLATAALTAACGGSGGGSTGGSGGTTTTPDAGGGTISGTSTDGGAGGTTLVIRGLAFSPAALTVAPGTVVTVQNEDGATPHSVTSESTAGAYTPGSVAGVSFDTGLFTGSTTFTVPANAPVGTVVPYYCRNHLGLMVNAAQAKITIGTTTTPTTTPTTPTTPAPMGPSGY